MANSEEYRDVLDCPAGRLGTALKLHRETVGMTYGEISRRVDYAFTPVVLQMVELGRYPLKGPQILKVIWGYDANPDLLLPTRDNLEIDREQHEISAGPTMRELNQSATTDGLLYEYLVFVYQIRNAEPGTSVALREEDLAVLSNTTDLPTLELRDRLNHLMASWNEAPPEVDESSDMHWSVKSRRSGLLERIGDQSAD